MRRSSRSNAGAKRTPRHADYRPDQDGLSVGGDLTPQTRRPANSAADQVHVVRGVPFLTAANAHQPSRATAALLSPLVANQGTPDSSPRHGITVALGSARDGEMGIAQAARHRSPPRRHPADGDGQTLRYDAAGFASPVDHQGIRFGAGNLTLTSSNMLPRTAPGRRCLRPPILRRGRKRDASTTAVVAID